MTGTLTIETDIKLPIATEVFETERGEYATTTSVPNPDATRRPGCPRLSREMSDSRVVYQHLPLPRRSKLSEASTDADRSPTDVQSSIAEAFGMDEVIPPGGSRSTPEFQVGDWIFHGTMTVLYNGGTQSLTNSVVHKGDVSNRAKNWRRTVAVKSVSLQSDEESVAMMRQECRVSKELGDSHPHILPTLHYEELQHELVILTLFAPAGTLSMQVRVGAQCIEELEAQRLSQQVMAALHYVHSLSIVHGDVKPQNIFLTSHGDAFLAQLGDFGLSTLIPKGQTSVHLDGVQGSYGYIPAEVIHKRIACFASDLFALGALTFRLLGCHDPFYPPSQVMSTLEFDDVCWNPISAEGRNFVTQLLTVDPEARGSSDMRTHRWLMAAPGELKSTTRGPLAPKTLPDVRFLTLEASQELWEHNRPQVAPQSKHAAAQ
mmetsp:Transcript_87008/g.243961  ORF Transcript_87008/g.243961 Transcript_87008/m.243961 type:complete len:432 (+) Transcript_87008:82-1377(+)